MPKAARSLFVAALLAWPGMAAADNAVFAQLTAVEGSIFVDSGKGFQPVKTAEDATPITLKLGDRVMVAKGGSATLIYGPNCAVPLQAPSTTTVKQTGCVVGTQGTPRNGAGGGSRVLTFMAMSGPLVGSFGLIADSVINADQNAVSP